jgi:hypothetical protein
MQTDDLKAIQDQLTNDKVCRSGINMIIWNLM